MKIKVHQNHWLPKLIGYGAITLYPHIFLDCTVDQALATHLLNHEWVHVNQVRIHGFFNFYSSYLFQYLIGLIKYRSIDKAYRSVSFEQDAYAIQDIQVVYLSDLDIV